MSTATASAPAATPAPAPVPTATSSSDLDLLPQLELLLRQGDFATAYQCCQDREIQDGGLLSPDSEALFFIQLCTAVLLNDLTLAKFVWKRIPLELKTASSSSSSSSLLPPLWSLLQLLLQKDYAHFYSAHSSLLRSPSFSPSSLSSPLSLSLSLLRSSVSSSQQRLIQLAYSSVPLETVQERCGLEGGEEEVRRKVQDEWGWNVEEGTGRVRPKAAEKEREEGVSMEQLDQLTAYVQQLEQGKVHTNT